MIFLYATLKHFKSLLKKKRKKTKAFHKLLSSATILFLGEADGQVVFLDRSLYTKAYYTIMQVIAKIFTFSSNFLLSRDIEYSHLLTVLSFYQFASNLLACFLFTWSHISTDWRYLWQISAPLSNKYVNFSF